MLYTDFLSKLDVCPFCEGGQRVLFSNKNAYITYAKAPYHPYHLLIIPKRHVTSYFKLKKTEVADIDKLIKVGAKILRALKFNDFTILVREGDGSDKSIDHVHYHIIPKDHIGDLDHNGDSRRILSNSEITKLCSKIIRIIKTKLYKYEG